MISHSVFTQFDWPFTLTVQRLAATKQPEVIEGNVLVMYFMYPIALVSGEDFLGVLMQSYTFIYLLL